MATRSSDCLYTNILMSLKHTVSRTPLGWMFFFSFLLTQLLLPAPFLSQDIGNVKPIDMIKSFLCEHNGVPHWSSVAFMDVSPCSSYGFKRHLKWDLFTLQGILLFHAWSTEWMLCLCAFFSSLTKVHRWYLFLRLVCFLNTMSALRANNYNNVKHVYV